MSRELMGMGREGGQTPRQDCAEGKTPSPAPRRWLPLGRGHPAALAGPCICRVGQGAAKGHLGQGVPVGPSSGGLGCDGPCRETSEGAETNPAARLGDEKGRVDARLVTGLLRAVLR